MNKKHLIGLLSTVFFVFGLTAQNEKITIKSAKKINSTTAEIRLSGNHVMWLDFYGENIFRVFQDNNGGALRDPQASPPAQILTDNPRKTVQKLTVTDTGNTISVATNKVSIEINKASALWKVNNLQTGKTVLESADAFEISPKSVIWKLKTDSDEYFYGGGVQNGRFSHKAT